MLSTTVVGLNTHTHFVMSILQFLRETAVYISPCFSCSPVAHLERSMTGQINQSGLHATVID